MIIRRIRKIRIIIKNILRNCNFYSHGNAVLVRKKNLEAFSYMWLLEILNNDLAVYCTHPLFLYVLKTTTTVKPLIQVGFFSTPDFILASTSNKARSHVEHDNGWGVKVKGKPTHLIWNKSVIKLRIFFFIHWCVIFVNSDHFNCKCCVFFITLTFSFIFSKKKEFNFVIHHVRQYST